MAMVIQNMEQGDLPAAILLWGEVGLSVGLSDTPEELDIFLKRNPTTSLCGILEGEVIATVLGGFDGRRGLVHHLAVKAQFQGRGYGRLMMEELERRFADMRVVKYSFWVESRNQRVITFYQHLGYEMRDLVTMSKTLRT